MRKQIITEAEITAAAEAKAERIRARCYTDAQPMERYRRYLSIYRTAVNDGNSTAGPYIIYKAYEIIAKERKIL